MKTSKAKNSSSETPASLVWHKDTKTIISIISIFITAIIGILTIINANAIARLDRAILQYSIGQYEPGKVFIEIKNNGDVSAREISISITWKPKIDLENCIQSPPFQDTVPITPIINNNLTYRFSSLAVGGSFVLICEITTLVKDETSTLLLLLSQYNIPLTAPVPTLTPLVTAATPVLSPTDLYTPVIPINPTLSPNLRQDIYFETQLTSEILEVIVVADNSKPAVETGDPPLVAAHLHPASQLPIVLNSFPDNQLEDLQTFNDTAFLETCNRLINQQVIWQLLEVKAFNYSPWYLSLAPVTHNELEIWIQESKSNSVSYGTSQGSITNLYGTIVSCNIGKNFQVWIKDISLSLRTDPIIISAQP